MNSYFAFGSNLDEKQMLERCPSAKIVGKFVLKNYKLAFTIFSPKRLCGCADVVKSQGDEVWGLVYELTTEDLYALDKIEMHPTKYKRFQTDVFDEHGTKRIVETYEVAEKSLEHLKPSREYFNLIINAAKKYSFPNSYKSVLASIDVMD